MSKPTTEFPTIAGKKTQLTIGGSGPPLLYLHSAGGETEWMPFHEKLAQHFTVYLPAHPGFADGPRSQAPLGTPRLEAPLP